MDLEMVFAAGRAEEEENRLSVFRQTTSHGAEPWCRPFLVKKSRYSGVTPGGGRNGLTPTNMSIDPGVLSARSAETTKSSRVDAKAFMSGCAKGSSLEPITSTPTFVRPYVS
jgi:hypothetical protein